MRRQCVATEVGNAAGQVGLHQYVLALQITMRNARLTYKHQHRPTHWLTASRRHNSTTHCTISNTHRTTSVICVLSISNIVPSVFWRCWLGGGKGIWPVKNWAVGGLVSFSVWSEVQTCIWPSWCHYLSLSLASVKFRLVFTFLVPAHPGCLRQRAIKWVCVFVCMCYYW